MVPAALILVIVLVLAVWTWNDGNTRLRSLEEAIYGEGTGILARLHRVEEQVDDDVGDLNDEIANLRKMVTDLDRSVIHRKE